MSARPLVVQAVTSHPDDSPVGRVQLFKVSCHSTKRRRIEGPRDPLVELCVVAPRFGDFIFSDLLPNYVTTLNLIRTLRCRRVLITIRRISRAVIRLIDRGASSETSIFKIIYFRGDEICRLFKIKAPRPRAFNNLKSST